MIYRPWVSYGPTPTEWTATYSQREWTPADGGVGGDDTAASGIGEAYVIREDDIVDMEWRVMESEMLAFRAFLKWARSSYQPFLMRLDVDDPTTEYEVYLHSPKWSDSQEVRYERDPEFRGVFIIPLSVRTEAGQPIISLWSDF